MLSKHSKVASLLKYIKTSVHNVDLYKYHFKTTWIDTSIVIF